MAAKTPLPIDAHLDEIVDALRTERRLVVSSAPGTGKTTRVPPALVDGGIAGEAGEVVVLVPRRLAARAAAARVAAERGVRVGGEIGYQVRHDKSVTRATRVRYVTEGVLVRQLVADPFLDGVGAVVLDEFHERHVEGDLALAMLREVRETVRDDLALVVMSATLDAEPIRAFLDGCPHVAIEARAHPVEIVHYDRAASGVPSRGSASRGSARERGNALTEHVYDALCRALEENEGDVLVFLPGVAEIRRLGERLGERPDARPGAGRAAKLCVLPLHGSLTPGEQDRALRPAPLRERKVVLATNIAESSLTIDGVSVVVDSGLARVLRHDPVRGVDTLRVERISRASATQRAGRAGRTGPGRCYQLWSRAEERALPAFDTPEIRRADLATPALTVRAFAGRSPASFQWFEAPEPDALAAADELLAQLGALEDDGTVTGTGRRMLDWPLHPRLARMLIDAASRGCRRAVAEIAALIAERDLLRRVDGPGPGAVSIELGDRVERLRAVERARFEPAVCAAHGVDPAAARAVVRARDQILGRRAATDVGAAGGAAEGAAGGAAQRCLLAGFPDRVVALSGVGSRDGVMVGGRGVRLVGACDGAGDASDLLVAVQVRDSGPRGRPGDRAQVLLAAPIERAWLEEDCADSVTTDVRAELDAGTGQIVAVRRTRYRDLVLDETRGGQPPDPEATAAILEDALRRDPFAHLGDPRGVRALIARVRWLRRHCQDADAPADVPADVPEVDDATVVAAASSLCVGERGPRSLRELRDLPVLQTIRANWSHEQRRRLDRDAPETIALPSGRRARIDWTSGDEPFVAARVQELFGLAETPRIGGGRVPLIVHVLAPNHRPVQITTDLSSFWAGVYPRVRSELRRRYPRHAWPEDPLRAPPESRPQPRRRPKPRR